MKGDRIYVGIRNGSEGVVSGEVNATQNGRSVISTIEKDAGVMWLVLQEVTRGGTVVEEIKVQLSEVVLTKTTRKDI